MDLEAEERRGRWTAAGAILALAAIAAACFLPTVSFGRGDAVLPWDAAHESAEMALVVLPPFLLAGALALTTAAGMLRPGGPHPALAWSWIVLLSAATLAMLSGVIWSFYGGWRDPDGNWAALGAALLAALFLAKATGQRGWRRWMRIVAAYAALVSVFFLPFAIQVAASGFGPWVGTGGYLVAGGVVLLFAAVLVGTWPGRSPRVIR
jgi:hypothetical protein